SGSRTVKPPSAPGRSAPAPAEKQKGATPRPLGCYDYPGPETNAAYHRARTARWCAGDGRGQAAAVAQAGQGTEDHADRVPASLCRGCADHGAARRQAADLGPRLQARHGRELPAEIEGPRLQEARYRPGAPARRRLRG